MLYYLSQALLEWSEGTVWAEYLSPLRLFRYITMRSAGAAVTALLLSWWLGPKVIVWLRQLKFGQHYPDKAEEVGGLARILSKKGTPTMGGSQNRTSPRHQPNHRFRLGLELLRAEGADRGSAEGGAGSLRSPGVRSGR